MIIFPLFDIFKIYEEFFLDKKFMKDKLSSDKKYNTKYIKDMSDKRSQNNKLFIHNK